jgi:hypothetical protein
MSACLTNTESSDGLQSAGVLQRLRSEPVVSRGDDKVETRPILVEAGADSSVTTEPGASEVLLSLASVRCNGTALQGRIPNFGNVAKLLSPNCDAECDVTRPKDAVLP